MQIGLHFHNFWPKLATAPHNLNMILEATLMQNLSKSFSFPHMNFPGIQSLLLRKRTPFKNSAAFAILLQYPRIPWVLFVFLFNTSMLNCTSNNNCALFAILHRFYEYSLSVCLLWHSQQSSLSKIKGKLLPIKFQ